MVAKFPTFFLRESYHYMHVASTFFSGMAQRKQSLLCVVFAGICVNHRDWSYYSFHCERYAILQLQLPWNNRKMIRGSETKRPNKYDCTFRNEQIFRVVLDSRTAWNLNAYRNIR